MSIETVEPAPQYATGNESSASRHPLDADGNEVEGGHDDDDDEDMESDEEELEDEDDDEAEAFARRLGEQLWADINRAHADRASGTTDALQQLQPGSEATPAISKGDAAIATMKTVLAFTAADPQVHAMLSSTIVPGLENTNVLDILKKTVDSGTVTREIAGPLSQILVALARSEVLFSPLPTLPPHLQSAKRKRDDVDDDGVRPLKRAASAQQDLQTQLTEAIGVITKALNIHHAPDAPLDPSVIASIQLQLHQVFLFALTSSQAGGQDPSALQEISGLIQVLGVLSGIQITPAAPTTSDDGGHPLPPQNSDMPWLQQAAQTHQFNDIGTAVYPCLLTGCEKTFVRLYNLRQHQRAHSVHRPFKCDQCPASFARNHDLKRHVKGHDRRAFRCCGCNKIFSRRDAIKRHKGSSKKGADCAEAETEEVEVENLSGEEVREGRRAKMWSGITTSAVGEDGLEEGELRAEVVAQAQAAVTHLHALLQGHVASALGTSGVPAVPPSLAGADTGQATLASVIARATAVANVTAYNASVAPPPPDPVMASLLSSSPVQAAPDKAVTSLSSYGLNEDQMMLLEQAIAGATAAAQAQAEAEAMLEEEEEHFDDDEEFYELRDDGIDEGE